MKTISYIFSRCGLALVLSVALQFYACGTEVGNGHAGPSIDGLITKNKTNRRSQESSEDAHASESNAPASGQAPKDAMVMVNDADQFLQSLLNPCGSPLLDLSLAAAKTVWRTDTAADQSVEIDVVTSPAQTDGSRLWELTTINQAGLSHTDMIRYNENGFFIETQSPPQSMPVAAQKCQGPTEDLQAALPGTSELFTKKTVVLQDKGITLQWYVSQDGNSEVEQVENQRADKTVTLKKQP